MYDVYGLVNIPKPLPMMPIDRPTGILESIPLKVDKNGKPIVDVAIEVKTPLPISTFTTAVDTKEEKPK